MWGCHVLKAYSRTQSKIALSSAEAELYSTVTAASEGLGLTAMARDFGLKMRANLLVDASAAIGIAERKGLGKVRHLDTQALWIQDAVRSKRVTLEKVAGTLNPADLMTKHLDQKTLDGHLQRMQIKISEGRSATAPTFNDNGIVSLVGNGPKTCKRVSWADATSDEEGGRVED